MSGWRLAAGVALAALGWTLPRTVARTRLGLILAADLTLPAGVFLLVTVATAKPIFAGMVVLALLGGLAFGDYFKRMILREPAVFSDMSELIELVRHPSLYLPFVGPVRVMVGATFVFAIFILLLITEPPLWVWSPWICVAALGGGGVLFLLGAGPLNGRAAALVRRLKPSGDPSEDASRLGPVATLFVHGIIARSERRSRIAQVMETAKDRTTGPPGGHVVLIQCESFVDPRSSAIAVPADLLPHLDAARSAGAGGGRLRPPTWGANTVRTEFQVLTGIVDQQLGFDRFNPYHGFARKPLPSLAWTLRARGYRTVCVHPYDPRFYGRHKVLPQLGFERFEAQAAFIGAPRRRGYVTDAATGAFVAKLLAEADQPTFVFIITMENHGPWGPAEGLLDEAAVYAEGLKHGDALFGQMVEAVGGRFGAGLVCFYGDHAPMIERWGDDENTDWTLWSPDAPGIRRDLAASELASACLDALDAANSA